MHSYLYEPRPSVGRYYLSNNIWRDAFSTAPWATDLTKLFDQNVVLAGLRTLVPYFTFTGDTQYEYLTPLDADQQNLQQAKQDGDDVAGTPFTACTRRRRWTTWTGIPRSSSAAGAATRRSPTSRSSSRSTTRGICR